MVYGWSMQSSTAVRHGDACFENLQELDRQLARAARKSGPLRYALGLGLNALAECDGHAALGFTSIDDYARERCEYGSTAIGQARRLAQKTASLPQLRAWPRRSLVLRRPKPKAVSWNSQRIAPSHASKCR
jgi:hypothetical protein